MTYFTGFGKDTLLANKTINGYATVDSILKLQQKEMATNKFMWPDNGVIECFNTSTLENSFQLIKLNSYFTNNAIKITYERDSGEETIIVGKDQLMWARVETDLSEFIPANDLMIGTFLTDKDYTKSCFITSIELISDNIEIFTFKIRDNIGSDSIILHNSIVLAI